MSWKECESARGLATFNPNQWQVWNEIIYQTVFASNIVGKKFYMVWLFLREQRVIFHIRTKPLTVHLSVLPGLVFQMLI